MPRYRFSWFNLPAYLLEALADKLGLQKGGDVPDGLRITYGMRPQESFLEDTWELLRESWLIRDSESREEIAGTLRERKLGEVAIVDDLAYLRSLRNTVNLRRVALPVFINLGESLSPHSKPSSTNPTIDGRDDTPKGHDDSENRLPKKSGSVGLPKKDGRGINSSVPETEVESSANPPLDSDGNPIEHFRQWLLENVRTITKKDGLEPDDDGDIPVDVGSARTYVSPRLTHLTPREKALSVDIYSILLEDVEQSIDLLTAINRINCDTPFAKVKFLLDYKQVILHHEMVASALSTENFVSHLGMIAQMADSLDSELQKQFGGVLHTSDPRADEQDV